MKIVIAPDKFKGCLTASEVARALAEGVRKAAPEAELDLVPMADGGEGTVEAIVTSTGGRIVTRRVSGPLPRMRVDAPIGLSGDGKTAVIEMASASGLHLLKDDQCDPLRTTTYGTGELLRAAAELGATHIILGIGGSASIDGGIGVAQAWDARFVLKTGQVHTTGDRRLSGGDLSNLLRLDAPPDVPSHLKFTVACDVANPLYGPDGAAPIFGPQKGASPEQVKQLDDGLRNLARLSGEMALADRAGAGAAGGLGFGMMAFFHADIRSGVEIVIDATRLRERVIGADLVLTGEGRLDAQTAAGKTVLGVSQVARSAGVPCVALAGAVTHHLGDLLDRGLTAAFSVSDMPMALEQAMIGAHEHLARNAEHLIRLWQAIASRTTGRKSTHAVQS